MVSFPDASEVGNFTTPAAAAAAGTPLQRTSAKAKLTWDNEAQGEPLLTEEKEK